jgi:ATP-binding cassette subfamily B protein/subfamily B ATP-binding cassette protein MsbA
MLLEMVGMLFSLISPLLTRSLIDDVFIAKNTEIFARILVGIVVLYLVSAVSNYFSGFVGGRLNLSLFREINREAFNAIQISSLEETQRFKVGDMLSRVMGNVNSAVQLFSSIIPQFIMSILGIVLPFVIMVTLNLRLSLIVSSPVLLFVLSSRFFGNRIKVQQKRSLEKIASVHSFLKEALSSLLLLKALNLEEWSGKKFDDSMDGYYEASLGVTKTSALSSSIGSLIYGVPMILLFVFGGFEVINGSLTIGTLTAFMGYTGMFFSPISRLSSLWNSYKSSSAALERVEEIFELKKEDGNKPLEVREGRIEFLNVSFSYGDKRVLENFSAEFEKGLNYIIGENGTGKTTILKLICALYLPGSGEIRIDGESIADVRKRDLRENIAMVFSDPYLFDLSVYENIILGRTTASREEVIEASKLARAHEFIERLPDGYETMVGESGYRLSSGEQQRIALARAILKNAPVMLLDEVTKSIDPESKQAILSSIRSLKGKTVLYVTHDMSEVEDGRVIDISACHSTLEPAY